jgi:superkiller protein 3
MTSLPTLVAPIGLFVLLSLAFSAAQEKPTFEEVITRAVVAEREGRLEDATNAFQEAARLRPEHPRVYYSLALLLLQRGLLNDALAAVDQALALDPEEPLFYLLQGEIFLGLRNLPEAERAYQSVIRLDPDSGEAYLSLADLYLASEQFEKSTQALRFYLEIHPEDTQALFYMGGVLAGHKKREEALEFFRQVIDRKPDHGRAWFHKAHLEAQDRETMDQALASFQKSLQLDPAYPPTHYEYGALLVKLGRTEEAIAAFEKAIELAPDLSQATYALGSLLSREGRTEEAQEYLTRFKAQRDQQARKDERVRRAVAALGSGRQFLEENRLEDAIEAFLEMTELDPTSHQGYSYLAKTHRSLGEIDVAIAYIRRAIELAPGASEYPYLLSLFLRDKRDLRGGLEAIRLAVRLGPRNGLLHNALGVILGESGDQLGAVAAFETAAELDPENPTYSLNLAAAYEKLGEAEKSAEAMKRYREQWADSIRP